jgi:hypothetical protein
MKNWKTTLAGAASILTGLVQVIKGDIATGATAIVTGVGLIFAKDHDVTGK